MALAWRCFAGLVVLGKNTSCRFLSITALRCGRVVPFQLSDIGEGIRDVTVKEWFVKPGDKVSQFDNICEVQSDKASVTITSRYDGVIKKLHFEIDDVALVGQPLIDIELDDDVEKNTIFKSSEASSSVSNKENDEISEEPQESQESNVDKSMVDKVLATPAVRKMAMEHNIRLKDVIATGKNGRILKEDVLLHLEQISSTPETSVDTEKLKPQINVVRTKKYSKHMWKTMTQSLSIPHFVYNEECNITQLSCYRNEIKESLKKQGISLTLMPFFIKAASRALEKIPELNAWLDEENETIRIFDEHNIGVAMDTSEGLVVPNIKNVQDLSVIYIAKELNRLQELGKKALISPNDLARGTFSLSNIGILGGTYMKPVILPPQITIGAFGRVQRLPRFDEKGNVIAADIIHVSWAADHRVVDGVTMAKFSNLWKHYVENPMHLLLGV